MKTAAVVALGAVTVVLAGPSMSYAEPERVKWKLVWADEFEREGQPNPANWVHELGYIRNKELQEYTSDKRNARVEDGCLILEVHQDSAGKTTSGSLNTQGRHQWTYGRFEMRAKVPNARGAWPAFWTLGASHGQVRWPQCGEIDIMEVFGHTPGELQGNLHTQAFNHVRGTQIGSVHKVDAKSIREEFHTYAVEWEEGEMRWYFDETCFFTVKKKPEWGQDEWPFDQPHYILVNVAWGGTAGGRDGVDADALPQRMTIDYIRVYQRP